MATQIRPNRLEVSDRFPMLGFTVRTDGNAKRFEIAIGTAPDLFGPDGRDKRNRSSFYSTRATGPLTIERGEAVYVLPSEVLARFVGQQKLYYGLATFSNGVGSAEVVSMPKQGSPYINVSGLTGRSLQRVRLLPNRQRAASSYGKNGSEMEWAGDAAAPGTQPASPVKGETPKESSASAQPGPVHYDDGFGPLHDTPHVEPKPQAKSLADDTASDEDALHGIDGPLPEGGDAMTQSFGAITPEYPGASRFEPAANFKRVSGTRTINRIVIHITDGHDKIGPVIEMFQQPKLTNKKGKRIYVSAHYIVGQDGEVVQMVKNNDIAWHASQVNQDSIGIEHVARSPHEWSKNDAGLMPTPAEYCASAKLVNWLCSQYNLPMDRDHIVGHSEASPKDNHDDCPNGVWDWDYYMGLVTSGTCTLDTDTATASSLAQSSSAAAAKKKSKTAAPTPRATALRQVDPAYAPSNTQDALTYMQQFQDRKQAWKTGVPDTTFFPHSAICRLRIFQSDGEYIGTGFYIASDRILTCAHNVADATSVTVIPGKNDAAEPFGSFSVQPSDWAVHPKYKASSRDFDLAVIKVSTPPPAGQAFTILEELLQCQESPIIVCGYAADTVNKDKQHLDGDAIRMLNDTGETFLYNLQTEPGNSGSPVYYVTGRDDEALQMCILETRLVGVHVASVEGSKIFNQGCRLTADKIAWINSVGRPFSAGAQAYALGWKKKHAQAHALESDLQPAQLPPAKKITGWQKALIRGAVDALVATGPPPMPTVLPLLIRLVNEQGFSVGIGLGGDAGLLGGAGLGFGVILAPNDDVGVFGEVEISAGLLAGLSAGARVIVIRGGIDTFNETGYALGVTVEDGPSVSAIALFNAQRQFHGVSFQLGVGAALSPVQIFTSVEKSVSTAVTQSLAEDEDSQHGIEGPIPDQAAAQSLARSLALTPEYPQASRFEPAASVNYRTVSGTRTINRVVIHITDGGSKINGTIGWFQNPNQRDAKGNPIHVSAHYVVGQDGEVVQMVKHNDVAWHASSANGDSIGIEHVANTRGLNPTAAQYCASAALANWLASQFNLPMDRTHILGHSEADPKTSHKACPNAVWDWDYYMGMVTSSTCYDPATTSQSLAFTLPPAPPRRKYAQGQAAERFPRVIENTAVDTVTGGEGNVSWELDQFFGTKTASLASAEPLQSAETIHLANWPYCDHANGSRSCAWFAVDWKFGGGALGQVRITPSGSQQGAKPLHVEARIEEGKNRDLTTASLVVRFIYHFSTDGPEVVAVTELTLYGDGSIDQKSNWQARAAA